MKFLDKLIELRNVIAPTPRLPYIKMKKEMNCPNCGAKNIDVETLYLLDWPEGRECRHVAFGEYGVVCTLVKRWWDEK